MILEDFLNNCKFGVDTITIPQGQRQYYKFLHDLILDGHIPIHKVVGFTTKYTLLRHNAGGHKSGVDLSLRCTKRELNVGHAIAATRDLALAECNFDLNERFLHIVLKPTEFPFIYSSTDEAGPVPTTEMQYPLFKNKFGDYLFTHKSVQGEEGHWITENDYYSDVYGPWFTFLGNSKEFQIYFYVLESTGYQDANTIHNFLPKQNEVNNIVKNWIPFDQNFNLSEFIRVKPMPYESNVIRLDLRHRMSMDFLKERMENLLKMYNNNQLNEEEQEWLKYN